MLRVAQLVSLIVYFYGLFVAEVTSEGAFTKVLHTNSHYAQYQDRHLFYQGDIKVPHNSPRRRYSRAATSDPTKLWPNSVIPYRIADSITRRPEHAKILKGAIAEWERKTCLRFIERTTQTDYVEFYYGQGCNSDVGAMKTGRQTTSIGKGCEDHGIMVHEIGHLIGLYHEQNRPDRDQHVKIEFKNVHPQYFYAFEVKDANVVDSRGVPYDYYSVMHYGSKDFSKNGRPTILSKKEGITEFGNNHISPLDAKIVNLMYKCPELIQFPRDFYWRHSGRSRIDTSCIQVNEPEDPNSWGNNFLCKRKGKMPIGLVWSHTGRIDGMSCVKAEAPSKSNRYGWNNNYFCWPSDSVYKFTWMTEIPPITKRRSCLKLTEPRDRVWSRERHYLCGEKDESPLDGHWSDWSEWSRCSRQCGGGVHRRIRDCNNPRPAYGGKYCEGLAYETGQCGMKSCGTWPIFPDDFVYKEFIFPPDDMICLRTYERFDYFTWGRYLFCSPDDKKDPLFDWSDSGPLPGMKCTRIYNPVESRFNLKTWDNNFLCTPKNSPYNLEWSRTGPIEGQACLRWRPKSGRDGWDNSWLCNKSPSSKAAGARKDPIDGAWGQWSDWSVCSRTCDGGFQKRERKCDSPAPQHGGKQCEGATVKKRICNPHRCAVDGGWSFWSAWESCTKTCGGGEQRRTRTCTNPAPQSGGEPCKGRDTERKRCNDERCPIHGGWSSWSWWARCTKTCGGGVQARSRMCNKPSPRDGGRTCPGKTVETRSCNSRDCPIDGQWAPWSSWRACSKSCSGGIQLRTRQCTNPSPQNGGRPCFDKDKEERRCNTTPCPIHGGWSAWFPWGDCSRTCSGGIQKRMRVCTNPIPRYGGSSCFGDDSQTRSCGTQSCPQPPVDGKWTTWSSWSSCTKTCAGGIQQQTRTCTNPKPQNGGQGCAGRSTLERRCNTMDCRVDGKWSSWSSWQTCSRTCGGGMRKRTRSCTNPAPKGGGRGCYGRSSEQQICNRQSCRVDGKWSSWSSWQTCSRTCGGGAQMRTRTCTNPAPIGGGRSCYGSSTDKQSCNPIPCRVDGKWSSWSSWKPCSRSCGGGYRRRTRTCSNPSPMHGGRRCYGRKYEYTRCNIQSCRIDGQWSSWSGWDSCSMSCGGGTQSRTRACNSPAPRNGGRQCPGQSGQTRNCNLQKCAIAARGSSTSYWAEWASWSDCSRECGGGSQRRIRKCIQNGPDKCPGWNYNDRRCNTNVACPSAWSTWGACSASCGGGIQQRRRVCRGTCRATTTDTRKCNTGECPPACSETQSGTSGRLRSPGYPRPYPPNQDCVWVLTAPEGHNVRLTLRSSRLETGTGATNCPNDYLEIRDGPDASSRMLDRLCGSTFPRTFVSSGQSLWVKFHSNYRIGYKGFYGSWTATQETPIKALKGLKSDQEVCGGTITKDYGILRSPGYPNKYPAGLDCQWKVFARKDRRIRFWFGIFDIYDERWCRYDYLSLRDGESSMAPSLGRHCGNRKPGPFETTGNSFLVNFRTADSHRQQRQGFMLVWTSYRSRSSLAPRKNKNRQDACDNGWITQEGSSFCYLSSKTRTTWQDSKLQCNAMNADLVTIDSQREQNFVRTVARGSFVWLGFTDLRTEGRWIWESSHVETPNSFTNWARGEPSNGGGRKAENCAVMKPNGEWNDYPCSGYQLNYICKKKKRS
ncbi:SCO-spondin isoform X3 [Nematostella vectensis]|uniref:SCO-spondin isoform X3 n=1 Tax=Nematostella vectensis TaxID=45351 RepID=UPI002077010D|nr:SCO-spondin isoform X3 [Nematostella vectensis]